MQHRRLWAEFAVLYLALPLVIAVVLPPGSMFPALFAGTAAGLYLLHRTAGFHWRDLVRGRVEAVPVALFAAATCAVALVVSLATTGDPLRFIRSNPGFFLVVMVFYPLLSALPQEMLFRALWFRRYGAILPGGWPGMVLNAAVFSLAHLMYWSGIVAMMTFAGGLAFAWAYERRGSFPMAVAMHALAGQIVFALGLGMFFYSGNVLRPF
ncbi:MAG: lysostaphin resistance A-like protein [Gemmobacter sp.]